MDTQKLLTELISRSRMAKENRIKKIISRPYKMLFPEILRLMSTVKKVTAQTFWGSEIVVVLPEEVSVTIWRYGYFDEDVCFYLLNFLKEDMVFIDVGAHYGVFTSLASYLVKENGIILSIEPTPDTYTILKNNNIRKNNVRIFNVAAFNNECKIILNDYGILNSAYNSIFQPRKENKDISKNTITVFARRIDNLIKEEKIQRVDVVKIDAESSEFQVLNGMEKTLTTFRPKVILEIGDFNVKGARDSEKIIAFLKSKKYQAYEYFEGQLVGYNAEAVNKYKNLIFIPDENKLS